MTDKLIEEGWQVVGLDNMMCGSLANLKTAFDSGRFRFVEHDIVNPISESADLVFNLACPASPPRYMADPVHTLRTSVVGVLNVIEAARPRRARVVHTSTSEIYGDPEVHPQVENYRGSVNPIGPRACYDEGKRAAETILFDLHRNQGLDIGVCRIFNTYGPRMDPFDGRVVTNLLRQALMGEAMTIYGRGDQTRSFCYVDDLIDGIYRLSQAGKEVTGPINLGNPVEMTILELAETIRELMDRDVDIRFEPLPVDDPTRRRPDISLAAKELGWAPKVALKDGLTRTLDYIDDLISSGRIAEYAEADRVRFKPAAE